MTARPTPTSTRLARFDFQQYRREWIMNPRGDVLAGIVVALALIPEAIGFSIIAGVDPQVGLYASFIIAMVIAFIGGRPGMISAATGAMALIMTGLVKDHGLPYLFAATILTGVFQIVFGWARLARYLKFVPRSVMVGFVNALAILIFSAQLPQFVGRKLADVRDGGRWPGDYLPAAARIPGRAQRPGGHRRADAGVGVYRRQCQDGG